MMEDKQRVIQEYVPGKQVTLAHIIANPTPDSFEKLGITAFRGNAVGVFTLTPSEATLIAVDITSKSGDIEVGFVDRFSGTVVITGDVSSVEASFVAACDYLRDVLDFSVTNITKT